MEDSTEVNETPDVCRLCLDDLSTFPEYYSIDEELADLTETLTGILVIFCCFCLLFSSFLISFLVIG